MIDQFSNEPIEQIPDPNIEYYYAKNNKAKGFTYLMKLVLLASNQNSITLIKELIEKEPYKINERNSNGWSALHFACIYGNLLSSIDIVKILLENKNIDVNIQCNNGYTPLMGACGSSNTTSSNDIIKLLLNQNDIDVNKFDYNNMWNSLNIACRLCDSNSSIETVKLLLNHKDINVNLQNVGGYTPLMMSCRFADNNSHKEAVKLLLSHKNININIKDQYNESAFTIAKQYANKDGRYKINKILIRHTEIDSDAVMKSTTNKNLITKIIKCHGLNIKKIEIMPPELFNELLRDYENYIIISHNKKSHLVILNKVNEENYEFMLNRLYWRNYYSKYILTKINYHQNLIYCKPGNIFPLCQEIDFHHDFCSKRKIFDKLNNKLKFLFDIKDEYDMMNKIVYHIENN